LLQDCTRTGSDERRAEGSEQVFLARRSKSGADETHRVQLRAELENILANSLSRLASGQLAAEQSLEVRRSLVLALARAGVGQTSTREAAAQIVVQQLFDQARPQPAQGAELPGQQLARAALSREVARQLSLMADGKSAGADAIATDVPAGHRALAWAKLGGFEYREGAPLPPDVLALAGQRVTLVGFIMSLGDMDT
jgi:hypothetical protein